MNLTISEFDALRNYVREVCAIDLGDDKQYLVQQRLEPIAEKYRLTSFASLVSVLEQGHFGIRDDIITAITTNETSFFRDTAPFKMFHQAILPRLCRLLTERRVRVPQRKGAKVCILSAGSSSGQEAYSIGICIHEFLAENPGMGIPEDFSILGIDISSRMLSKAMSAEYTDAELARGMSDTRRTRFFQKEGSQWVAIPALRNLVEFRRANLAEPLLHLGGFDVVFCRNVLIYFQPEVRKSILDQFYQMLSPQGDLILGSTEGVYGITGRFESVHEMDAIRYRKR